MVGAATLLSTKASSDPPSGLDGVIAKQNCRQRSLGDRFGEFEPASPGQWPVQNDQAPGLNKFETPIAAN